MSEQATPEDGTPAVAGPETDPGTVDQAPPYGDPNDPYEQRYNDLRSWTDRVSQENAQHRQEMAELQHQQEMYELLISAEDSDTRRQAAEALGYQLAEDPDPETNEDPLEQYGERLGRLEQSVAERDQQAQETAYAEQVRAVVDDRLDALNVPKEDQDWVLAYAINALPVTDEGLPDLAQAFQVFQARETDRQRAWARGKRAPRISPDGQPATEVPNLDDRQDRQDFIMRRMQDGEQAGY